MRHFKKAYTYLNGTIKMIRMIQKKTHNKNRQAFLCWVLLTVLYILIMSCNHHQQMLLTK